jgi:adenylosuccinate synthase
MINHKAVIDLGFGDNGKGSVTAFLCHNSRNPLVTRFSGGHQAGHTVVHNGIRHVFSSFGSGTLQGVPTDWQALTFSPNAFLNEWKVLSDKGITPIINVNGKCPVTTPYDIHENKTVNSLTGHGSCGVGIGTTIEREKNHYSLLVEDLQYPSIVRTKMEMIREYYGHEYLSDVERRFIVECEAIKDKITIDADLKHRYATHIYEGSQGLLLDEDIGFFPHVSWGNMGSKGLVGISLDEVWYVTRAYQTRHGNGPMTNEDIGHNIKENPDETNKENYQGVFRKTLLDLDLLEYALAKDNSWAKEKFLVITCLDHVEDEWRFTYKGQIIPSLSENDFIEKIVDILGIPNVYISKSDDYTKITEWGD